MPTCAIRSETAGAKIRRREGNSPDRQLRALSEGYSGKGSQWFTDNQEVGLEAATLERVRNSSLVECPGADNVTGLSLLPKLRVQFLLRGRGAFHGR